jgi:hypothetical protein
MRVSLAEGFSFCAGADIDESPFWLSLQMLGSIKELFLAARLFRNSLVKRFALSSS